MGYELFDQKSIRTTTPNLTISSQRLHFSADASEFFGGAEFAHILWDRGSCKVGVSPLKKRDATAYAVTYPKGKRGAGLSAQAFLRYIGWNSTDPCSVPVHWNEKEKLIEAQLPRERIGGGQEPKGKRRFI
jgi:hypothetical protein